MATPSRGAGRLDDLPLRTWVSDNVIELLGLSDSSMVDYCIATATNARSEQKLRAALAAADLPDSDKTRRFVSDLFRR
ncbi:hypothetical protein HK405_002042, partial [Cladochytrium tenue]